MSARAPAAASDAIRRLVHGAWGVHQRIATRLDPGLAEACGLDLDDFVLLETFALTDLAPGEVATALRLQPHTVSRGLGRLEEAGLVLRRIDPEDARRRTVALTDGGRTALARAHAYLERTLGHLLGELSPDRALLVLDALTRLATGRDPEPAAAP